MEVVKRALVILTGVVARDVDRDRGASLRAKLSLELLQLRYDLGGACAQIAAEEGQGLERGATASAAG